MKRREFFGSILLLGAAFGMPWPETGTSEAADSSAISAPRDQPGRAVLLLSSALAGFQYYGGTSLWP